MPKSFKKPLVLIAAWFPLLAFLTPARATDQPVVLATTSMIGSMLELVAGEAVEARVLIPPRSCPGHFDIRPQDAAGIASAGLVIRHDFQAYLDDKLTAQNPRLVIEVLVPEGHLMIPSVYLGALEKIAGILSRRYPQSEAAFRRNLEAAAARIGLAEPAAREKIRQAALAGTVVLGSDMQEPFLRWAGIEVAASFSNSSDELSVRSLARLIGIAGSEKASFIAGNLQSGGEEVALALARQTGLPAAILSNFPGTNDRNPTYIDLLLDNIDLLARAKSGDLP